MAHRNRDWLTGYVTQKIPQSPRNPRYQTLFNATLDNTYLGLDLDWLRDGEKEGYFARNQTNIIGRLAFAWHAEGFSFYHDGTAADMLRRAFLHVAAHITPEGQFIWPNDKDMYWAGSHEHAWRLEPLLIGAIWADDVFSKTERLFVHAALRRAADWLIANPCIQHNNRGAVWCAIATLCGIYYDESAMLDAVTPHAEAIMRGVILDDGEIGEHTKQYAGGGPCTNYTYTGLGYVYLYRLFSGDDTLDDLLLKGARWLSIYNTLSGYPIVAGASVRVAKSAPVLADGLPFLEWASHSDPFFANVAQHHLDTIESTTGEIGKHIISPTIWAMLARGVEPGATPDWYTTWHRQYKRPSVQYALIGRRYQTGITSRVRPGPYRDIPEEGVPLRGLQTFAMDDEVPILFHGRKIVSTTRAGKIDTCRTDVSETIQTEQNDLTVICERRSALWTLYVFTPVSAVVIYGGVQEEIRSFWSLYETNATRIALDRRDHTVAFSNREGRVYFLHGSAELYAHEEGGESRWILDVIAEPPISAFAFSDTSFAFCDWNPDRLIFSDDSGAYQIVLTDITTPEGDLNSQAKFRLEKTP